MTRERPGDVRGFLHKSKFGKFFTGAASTLISGIPFVGSAVEGIRGIVGGGGSRQPACPPGSIGCPGSSLILLPPGVPGQSGPCDPGTVWDPDLGYCVSPRSPFGGQQLADQFGEAVMGQYGAALVPKQRATTTLVCPKGAVLGKDDLCYNKKDITNKERQWPRGRRPLLTGGEMRCISVASSASRKLQRKQKQLQDMGMLPKPRRSSRKALPSGHHSHVAHN